MVPIKTLVDYKTNKVMILALQSFFLIFETTKCNWQWGRRRWRLQRELLCGLFATICFQLPEPRCWNTGKFGTLIFVNRFFHKSQGFLCSSQKDGKTKLSRDWSNWSKFIFFLLQLGGSWFLIESHCIFVRIKNPEHMQKHKNPHANMC